MLVVRMRLRRRAVLRRMSRTRTIPVVLRGRRMKPVLLALRTGHTGRMVTTAVLEWCLTGSRRAGGWVSRG